MEENRTHLRRSALRLVAVIYVLVIVIAIAAYFLINDLEQSGIVRDTQTERGWTTFALLGVWSFICLRLYRINTRLFDQRSQVIDARESEIFTTRESARLREQFMANMSHEIRTPLNAIIGFGNLLSRSRLEKREREISDNIQIASETLLAIVNDILDLSKIEAGMLILENNPFDPNGLLLSVQQMFTEKARQKNLSLDLHVAPSLPEQLVGDPTRLTQILVNLIGNALKFTERGGVVVSAAPLFDGLNGPVSLRLEVRDSGIGISEAQIERVFDRFTQSDEQTTRIYGGTGLGLSIVKQLVEAMQGSISVQSELNKGSVFTVILPFNLTQPKPFIPLPMSESDAQMPDLTSTHILVAEDNPMNRRVVELLFSEWKIEYAMTHNGREAVDILAKTPSAFDLVLMDIQMPEMDGYEATQQIRQKLNLDIPIVAMTAHALAGEREKCLHLGMNDYLTKPIREQELRQLIARVTQKTNPVQGLEMDLAYLRETTMGNAGYQRELAQIFLSQVPKDLDAIAAALSAGDLAVAARAAHNMKSTVDYMGFAQNIGRQLSAFESDCKLGSEQAALLRALEHIREQSVLAQQQVQAAFVD